jgi:hypothetical protein
MIERAEPITLVGRRDLRFLIVRWWELRIMLCW